MMGIFSQSLFQELYRCVTLIIRFIEFDRGENILRVIEFVFDTFPRYMSHESIGRDEYDED